MSATRRLCNVCGISPKGAASERAIVSPTGVVHLLYIAAPLPPPGRTFCGKTPTDAWQRP